jgi:CBS domain-containing protein
MLVEKVMTVHTARIRITATLGHAATIVALSGASDLMAVDEQNNFIGVLSEGDLLRACMPDFEEILKGGGTLDHAYGFFVRKGRELMERPIEPLVIKDPISLRPDDPVAKAATVMVEKQIRRLPVVADGKLLGTVSRADLCRAVMAEL